MICIITVCFDLVVTLEVDGLLRDGDLFILRVSGLLFGQFRIDRLFGTLELALFWLRRHSIFNGLFAICN